MRKSKINIGIIGIYCGLMLMLTFSCKDGSVTPWLPGEPDTDLYPYFPCSSGDYWIYLYKDNMNESDTVTVSVTEYYPTKANSPVVLNHSWKNFDINRQDFLTFRNDTVFRSIYSNGEIVTIYKDSLRNDTTDYNDTSKNFNFNSQYLVLPLKESFWVTNLFFEVGANVYTWADSISVTKIASLTVPVKTFNNVYRLRIYPCYYFYNEDYAEIYYVPYVGIIKECYVHNGAENWSKSLIGYKVNKIKK